MYRGGLLLLGSDGHGFGGLLCQTGAELLVNPYPTFIERHTRMSVREVVGVFVERVDSFRLVRRICGSDSCLRGQVRGVSHEGIAFAA